MNANDIINNVPTDAPSSTTKPKNNLWTWLVGALACVVSFLYLKGISDHRETVRSKDETIRVWMTSSNNYRYSDSLKQVKLDDCNADKLQIQSNGQQQLLEYLELKPGTRQTISISPKNTKHE